MAYLSKAVVNIIGVAIFKASKISKLSPSPK